MTKRETLEGGTTFRWVHMKKFWSMWSLSRKRIKEPTAIWAVLLSAGVTGVTFQQNHHNTQLMVTPNEMVGLNCRDYTLNGQLLFLSSLSLVQGSS